MKKILVSTSGGKDSQASLKIMCEKYGSDNVLGVFADTGWEHPETYKHIERMKDFYNVDIETVKSEQAGGKDVESQILARGNFPSGRVRFCTSNLKTRPLYKHALKHALKHPFVKEKFKIVVGIRADESPARMKKYGHLKNGDLVPSEVFNEWSLKFDCAYRLLLPVLHWTEKEVKDYLNDEINPLYRAGFKRIGCFPCVACSTGQDLNNHYNYDKFGQEQKAKVIELERKTGVKHKPSDTGQACLFCSI